MYASFRVTLTPLTDAYVSMGSVVYATEYYGWFVMYTTSWAPEYNPCRYVRVACVVISIS